jgi:cyclase
LLLLDTVASLYQRLELPHIISEIVKDIFIPVCAGGGITSCQDAERLFFAGADKICVNTGAIKSPDLLHQLSREFGAQSIVLQVDTMFLKNKCQVFYNYGRDLGGMELSDWLGRAQNCGIGEVLVTSIEKDGTGRGPDIRVIEAVEVHARVPVIYGGGLSSADHIRTTFSRSKISAVALASYLHIDKTPISRIKDELKSSGIPVLESFKS